MKEKWRIRLRQKQRSCFFPWAALPLRNALRTVPCLLGSWGRSPVHRGLGWQMISQGLYATCLCQPLVLLGSPGLPKLPFRLPAYPAAISAFQIISRIVFRTAGGSSSFPRGCDGFAVGDLWQLVLGKCCERLWVEPLREAISSLCWEAYIASITWIVNFAF